MNKKEITDKINRVMGEVIQKQSVDVQDFLDLADVVEDIIFHFLD